MEWTVVIENGALAAATLLGWWGVIHEEARARAKRRARARPLQGGSPRCPFCHAEFEQDDGERLRVRCGRCDAVHHADCWAEHRSCSVYGCRCREAVDEPMPQPEAEAPSEAVAPAEEAEPADAPERVAVAAGG